MPHLVGLGISAGGLQLGSSSSLSATRKEIISLASSDVVERNLEPSQSPRGSTRRHHEGTWSRSRSRLCSNPCPSSESLLTVPELSPRPIHPVYHSTIYLPLSTPASPPSLPLTPPSTLRIRTDLQERANNQQQNGPFFGIAVGLSVLCGILVLGLSGSGIFAYYSLQKRNRRFAEATKEKDRVARASFESRGGICARGQGFHLTDRRSDWLRQGLDSPHLVLPERARSRNPYSSKSVSPLPSKKNKFGLHSPSRPVGNEKPPAMKVKDLAHLETKAKHIFSPTMPSPLGILPVWTVPRSPSGERSNIGLDSSSEASFELDASPPNFRKLVVFNASPPASSSSFDIVAVENTVLDDQKPILMPPASAPDELMGHITQVGKEDGNGQTQSQAAISEAARNPLSLETSNGSLTTTSGDNLRTDTRFVGMPSLSHDHPTDESPLHEDAPWTAPVHAPDTMEDNVRISYLPLEPSSSSSRQELDDKDLHAYTSVNPDNVLLSLKPSVSLPVPVATPSPSIASSTNFIFPSSSDSTFFSMHMMLLKDAPLPPPTIMVSTPTNASLRTRALAAFQMGSLLVDAWDDGSEDESDASGCPHDRRDDEESGPQPWAHRGTTSTVLHSKPLVQAQLPAPTMQSAHAPILVPARDHEVSKPKMRGIGGGKENTKPHHSLHNRSASDSVGPRSVPSITNASNRPTSIPVLSSRRISRLLGRGDQTAQSGGA
ncbi:hypothetical protein BS47DRAFT_1335111 [Hydnum rufescens UP504]|uniref:Uncharacterized protein n=1 Tax=Hydnum rufescens UP504 TaxID=1448309 RepID=A0A9P6BC17_9AGAM|nr:hypothetical protein BS47DRAFT_1335111 [Hydnum rufescens UP504]